jgi:hypothetical protein
MKGHLRERSPGHWAIVIETRDPVTGKRKRQWHFVQGHKAPSTGGMRSFNRRPRQWHRC